MVVGAVDSTLLLGLAANVVALGAVGAGLWQHHETLKSQRRLADLDNVRGLLDEAAVALHRAAYVLDEVRSGVTQHTPSFFTSESGTEVYTDLGKCGKDLDALMERLRVRFGRGRPVVTAFERADEAFLDIYRAAGLVRLEEPPEAAPPEAHEVRRFYDEIRDRLTTQREHFDKARDAFVDAANQAAGADLGA